MKPSIRLTGRTIDYDGYTVGTYAVDEASGEITVLFTKTLYRKENSYAMSTGLVEKIEDDVTTFFVEDKDDQTIYRFPKETYTEGRLIWGNNHRQMAPDVSENTGSWHKSEVLQKESSGNGRPDPDSPVR